MDANDATSKPADVEEFGYDNETLQDLLKWEEDHHPWFLFTRVLLLFASVIAISIGVFVMYTIVKFPKLKTRSNAYIFHLLLCNIIYCIIQPCYVSLYCIIYNTYYIKVEIMRVVWNIEHTFVALIFVYAAIIGCDWYSKMYDNQLFTRIQKKYYKFIICLLYLLAVLKISLLFTLRLHPAKLVLIFYCLPFTVINVFNFMKCCRKPKISIEPKYGLLVANTVIYGWLPVILYGLLGHLLVRYSMTWEKIFFSTYFIPMLLVSSMPIVITFLLKTKDNHFRTAFAVLLKRKVTNFDANQLDSYDEYDKV